MTLRNLLFAVHRTSPSTPRACSCCSRRVGYSQGWVTLGQITTAMLYVEALRGPLDRLVRNVDRLQVGHRLDDPAARHRRGAARTGRPGDRLPGRPELVGQRPALRLPRRPRRAARHRPRRCGPGSGSRSSGRAAPGKSTLGRLLAGINGAAHRLGHASAGSTLHRRCRWTCCGPRSRWSPRSTTCSSGSVRDNIVLAREDADDEAVVERAARRRRARTGCERLPRRAGHPSSGRAARR